MSHWQEICAEQERRLEKTEVLADKLDSLADKMRDKLDSELIDHLSTERQHLDRQLKRLRDKRFEVAVIGLEKSGKSALLNAWLKQEILPSEDRRCTYTTTEIVSVPTQHQQYLRLEYYSREEFDQLLQGKKEALKTLKPGSKDYKELDTDIQETEAAREKIYRYIRDNERCPDQPFKEVEEIADRLYETVAGTRCNVDGSDKVEMDRSRPRAIKRIQLATTRLANEGGIVFHDVPGFNSPVSKHREEAEQQMRDCDVIIFAKKMDNINLDVSETSMLGVADADHISLEQKVFLVTTQADKAMDREQYDKWLDDHRSEWDKVPSNRIIPVCAIAHLAQTGSASPDVRRLGQKAISKLNEMGIEDGIETLKNAVNAYINDERGAVLQKRCNVIVNHYQKLGHQIIKQLDSYRCDLPENASEEDIYGEAFNIWWAGEWKRIDQAFGTWYDSEINRRSNPDGERGEHQQLTELRDAYCAEVDKLFAELEFIDPDKMKIIYTNNDGAIAPEKAHYKMREELHQEIQDLLQRQLPKRLTVSLYAISQIMVDKAQELLWGLERVPEKLIGERQVWEKQLEYGFQTLFLRFGREAVTLLIEYPRHGRDKLLKEKVAEIRTLEAFYKGDDEKSNLKNYLHCGSWVLPDSEANDDVAVRKKISKPARSIWDDETQASTASSVSVCANSFEAVTQEIQEDLATLKDYLKYSVFEAAGFITYSEQELKHIKINFKRLEEDHRAWDNLVRTAVRGGAQNVPFKMMDRLKDFRVRREIARDIQEIDTLQQELV